MQFPGSFDATDDVDHIDFSFIHLFKHLHVSMTVTLLLYLLPCLVSQVLHPVAAYPVRSTLSVSMFKRRKFPNVSDGLLRFRTKVKRHLCHRVKQLSPLQVVKEHLQTPAVSVVGYWRVEDADDGSLFY